MEVTLIHPDAPELEFKPGNTIELAAYKSQGFVEKDKFVAQVQAASAVDEVAELKEKLAKETEARKEAEAKVADAEKRAESAEADAAKLKADAEEKAKAEADAAKKEKEAK